MNEKRQGFANIELQRMLQSGFDALNVSNFEKAAAVCKQTLAAAPRLPRAHFLAGLIALESGDRASAEQAFETTVHYNKMHAAAWARLAQLYFTSGRPTRAEAALHNAVHSQRGNPATLDLIGTVFRLAGNLAASREWHQRAVEKDGEQYVPFLINLANAHTWCGARDEAGSVLRRALEIEPDNAQAHWLLSRSHTATSRHHLETMQSIPGLSGVDEAYRQYAIGKELEDLEDWDAAFAAWQKGAAARRRTLEWDEAADTELFAVLESLFTSDWLESHRGECFDAGPVFIIGQPRTGTTLLDRMLNAHPVAASAGETRFLGYAIRLATGSEEPRQFTPELMRQASQANATAIGEAYVNLASSLRLEAAHIVDKLPSNYLYLPIILAALPNARIIHIRRDPMDTSLAIFKQLFADAYLYSYDLGELARHLRRYGRLMDVWRERFGDHFIEVNYEDLVSDTETALRPVLQYIGLSWNDDCLKYFEHDSAIVTASATQVREAPYQASIGRWRHFERQLEPARRILLKDPQSG